MSNPEVPGWLILNWSSLSGIILQDVLTQYVEIAEADVLLAKANLRAAEDSLRIVKSLLEEATSSERR